MAAEGSSSRSEILTRLRDETRPEHDAIESVLDLMDGSLTLATYRRSLEQFYGCYAPLEKRLEAIPDWPSQGLDLTQRRKAPNLEADLRVLGASVVDTLPLCRELPELADAVDGFGCLYVLEGSTLGGQFISRHVRQVLGVTPEVGGRFFHGYGEQTGEMWRQFGAALTAFAADRQVQDRIVASAIVTFRTIRQWFQMGQGR